MRILVTGANGYLGQGIVSRLLDDGIEVVATDFTAENIDPRAEIIECNIFEIENPYLFFGRPDVVLHLAWRNGFVHDADSHIMDLSGHYYFLKTMTEQGLNRLAVMGTMHEIGFHEGIVDENTLTNPASMYGIGKNTLRKITEVLCNKSGTEYQWLRGYYIVGNSERGASIFSKITAAEKRGDDLFPFTTGACQYDFVDYDCFCNMVAKAVEQDKILGIINICNGRPEKLADRVERFISDHNYKIRLDYGKYPDRPYDSKAVWGDSTKIDAIVANAAMKESFLYN